MFSRSRASAANIGIITILVHFEKTLVDNKEQHTVRSIISDICDDERYTAICKGNSEKIAIKHEILDEPFFRQMV